MSTESSGHHTHPGSVLANLAARREAIAASQELHLRVPRWEDPEVWVIYKPVDHEEISKAISVADKPRPGKRYDSEVNANADILIKGCIAVYAVLDGSGPIRDEELQEGRTRFSLREGEPEGDLTQFDPDLAQNLGLAEGATARQVVRKLFITEGDILTHARRVGEFSGYAMPDADRELEGE